MHKCTHENCRSDYRSPRFKNLSRHILANHPDCTKNCPHYNDANCKHESPLRSVKCKSCGFTFSAAQINIHYETCNTNKSEPEVNDKKLKEEERIRIINETLECILTNKQKENLKKTISFLDLKNNDIVEEFKKRKDLYYIVDEKDECYGCWIDPILEIKELVKEYLRKNPKV